MNLNWEAIGAVGELLGATAVFATLVYLATQIRQNTKMMKATIRQELGNASIDMTIQFSDHAAVFAKMQQVGSLPKWEDSAEELEAEWLTTSGFRSWEAYAWQHEAGLVDATEWEGLVEDMKHRATFPYYVDQWHRTRNRFSNRLRQTVDPIFGFNEDIQ